MLIVGASWVEAERRVNHVCGWLARSQVDAGKGMKTEAEALAEHPCDPLWEPLSDVLGATATRSVTHRPSPT